MRRNRADAGTITGITEATAERVRLGGDILIALAHAVAANEETQRTFRTAVLAQLSRIQSWVEMIHGAQIVETHISEPGADEKIAHHVAATE